MACEDGVRCLGKKAFFMPQPLGSKPPYVWLNRLHGGRSAGSGLEDPSKYFDGRETARESGRVEVVCCKGWRCVEVGGLKSHPGGPHSLAIGWFMVCNRLGKL